ncbi:tripartite tricarboxylate transporter substrate binding protein [Rhodococcus sp. 1R11]|uniref:tripartite tricarboxylate transporter substrate binding protein n=1 Tax=Rhodococcus sp. 1R11 TaxID=2559614 RepID=UPI001072DC39|nr:tripartite tricarboxylate transporter substrate-binding protein [Rhodococcus sp. 1R11]TFI42562.1 tripartite tricarboxylate transporter substrate binding protein [Rhodococcus sp. 1R11]
MKKSVFGVMIATALLMTGCTDSGPDSDATPTSESAPYPDGPVTMTAGADPGSGFDLTIRSVVDALQKEKIVETALPVQNRPGGSGVDYLATMVEDHRGTNDQLAVTSLSMMVNQVSGLSEYGYDDVTMIARLMSEYYVVVTRPGGPLADLSSVIAAIASDPSRVVVGAAHDDELPFGLLVSAGGGDPSEVRYVTQEGGRAQSTALLGGEIDVAIGGVSEFVDELSSGNLTGIGILADTRIPGLDIPTARELGLDVTLSNWRGIYGPPDMPTDAVEYWQTALGTMVETPTWKQIAERSKFTTTFMIGDEFDKFLADTQKDVETGLQQAPR